MNRAPHPHTVRRQCALQAGLLTLHGVKLAPVNKLPDLGRKLAEYRAQITARAFVASKKRLRPQP